MRMCIRRSDTVKSKWPGKGGSRRAPPAPADDDQLIKDHGRLDIQFRTKAAVVAGDHVDDDFEAAPQALNVGK